MKTFILEDDERRAAAMLDRLRDGFPDLEHVLVGTAPDAIQFLEVHLHEIAAISLDHDLPIYRDRSGDLVDAGTGRQVADFLALQRPQCVITLHSTNAPAVAGMKAALEESGWRTVRVAPYGDLEWIDERWLPEFRRTVEAFLGGQSDPPDPHNLPLPAS